MTLIGGKLAAAAVAAMTLGGSSLVGGASVRIESPAHDAVVGREVMFDVDVAVSDAAEFALVAEASLCLFVNGSLAGGCARIADAAARLSLDTAPLSRGRAWLHVELRGGGPPADGVGSTHASSKPVALWLGGALPRWSRRSLTALLTLTLDDAHRAMILVGSLRHAVRQCGGVRVRELIVVAPDSQRFALESAFSREHDPTLRTRTVGENALFGERGVSPRWAKYAVQMAVKLLAARLVETEFYLTLDADVVVVGALAIEALLPGGDRGAFVAEPRSVHPHWWAGSAAVLGLDAGAFTDAAFGVTPAVLSVAGAMATTASLATRLGVDWCDVWLGGWSDGAIWSEYTLYRLALDERRLFAHLHAEPRVPTLCAAVWFAAQLPWDAAAAFDDPSCVFSLIQSTTGLPPSTVARLVAPYLPDHPDHYSQEEGACREKNPRL